MVMKAKEYYADITSVLQEAGGYELAGKGNAYVRVDAEAKFTGQRPIYTDE